MNISEKPATIPIRACQTGSPMRNIPAAAVYTPMLCSAANHTAVMLYAPHVRRCAGLRSSLYRRLLGNTGTRLPLRDAVPVDVPMVVVQAHADRETACSPAGFSSAEIERRCHCWHGLLSHNACDKTAA
jgi:hypothetical protein